MRMEKVPTNPPGGAVEFHRCHLSLDVEQDKSIQRVQKKKKKRCLLKKAGMWESRHGWRNGRKTRMRLIGVSDGKKYGLSKGY